MSTYTADRIKTLRLRAKEIRETGEGLKSAESRLILLSVADDYDRLATALERFDIPAAAPQAL